MFFGEKFRLPMARHHHPPIEPWTWNIKKLRSCFNYRRAEWTKESLLKAPLISNYKLKRIFWLKGTAKFNINSKSTTRLICNSYLEISIARDLGGLAFISAIKTSRPFKLNIIFHPAWKSEWESRYEFIKNTISTQKSNDIAEKTNSLLFRWLETWIHLWHLLCDSLHTIRQFYVVFSTSYHAIRTVVWKVHSLIKVPSGLRRAEGFVLCVKYCIIVGRRGKLQMVSDDAERNNNCLSPQRRIGTKQFIVHEHKTVFGLNFLLQ